MAEWKHLTDEDRDDAFNSMPNMLDGFMKLWGWLHFAQAIEQKVHEKNAHLVAQFAASPSSKSTKEAELREALHAAATSLETISFLAGRKSYGDPPIPTYMDTFLDVRSFAANRATVARAALASSSIKEDGERAERLTENEIHAHDWWCQHCLKDVPPEMVTKDGEHYLEAGGCGYAVRGELKDAPPSPPSPLGDTPDQQEKQR